MTFDKEFPMLGQNVYVSFYTDGLVPVDMIGRCVHIKWVNELSTFTLLTQFSRHQFFFFSPLVLTVRVHKPHRIRNRFLLPAVQYKKRDAIKQLIINKI